MSDVAQVQTERLPWIIRALNVVEKVGNKLPHPFWLFWLLALLLGITSAIMATAGVTVIEPGETEAVPVRNLFTPAGLSMAVDTALDNYANFPPMITIVVVIMGVAIAERTGFLEAWMKQSVAKVPASLIVFVVAFLGTVAHVASAAAYVILVPLGGIIFRAVGRSPVLGVVVAYTSIASGYDASPIPTPNDAIFAGITTAAAGIVDPDAYVSPLSNWYFNIASSVLLALVITIVTELVLAKRPGLSTVEEHEEETINLSRKEQIGLRLSGIAFLVILAIVLFLSLPENGPLRGEGGSLDDSPLLNGIAFIIALIFGITGTVYGIKVGKITSLATCRS